MSETGEKIRAEGELKRVLKLPHLVVFGIAFMTPIAPAYIFGFATEITGGMLASAYAVAMVGMMLTAKSYGKMAKAFPYAGSAYTYTQRAVNPYVGFITGWALYLDYVLVPLINTIAGGYNMTSLLPFIPYPAWAVIVCATICIINYRGIKLTANTNNFLVFIMTIIVFVYLAFCLRYVASGGGSGELLSIEPFYNSANFAPQALFAGAAMGCFSFIGFDGITTLAEETDNPQKNIGRAAVLACFFGGTFYIIQAYITQSAWPDWKLFNDLETAYFEVSSIVGGQPLAAAFTAAFMMSVISSGLAGQASAARVMYGMGRDEKIPKKFFAYVHPKFNTPTNNIIIMAGIAIIGSLFLDLDFVVEMMSFGALFGFIFVNLSVIVYYYIKKKEKDVLGNLILPGLGFILCAYLWISLANRTLIIGLSWVAIGIIYLAVSTKGFKKEAVIYNELDTDRTDREKE